MNDTRTSRWPWILGVLLLAGTSVAVITMLNQNRGNAGARADVDPTPPAVVCIGLVDVEEGVANLHPLEGGKVVWVAKEGAQVKKGDPVLKLDPTEAKTKVDQAKRAVDEAEVQLEQAKKLTKKYELETQQQEKAIAAAEADRAAAQANLYVQKDVIKAAKSIIDAHEALLDKAKAALEAQKLKLEEMKLRDADLDIRRAQAGLEARQALLEQANYGLKIRTLEAPKAGKVLRVTVQEGESVGTSPKVPAVQFLPEGDRIVRAEVLQEWATRVKGKQQVIIEDDTYAGPKWEGEVVRLSDWYTHKRHIIIEPFMMNDVRTLECLVKVTSPQQDLRIGQRVRVRIKTS